ncbi:excisionase family DNA-binding protein [Geodermatophilus sp. SYSU D00803]
MSLRGPLGEQPWAATHRWAEGRPLADVPKADRRPLTRRRNTTAHRTTEQRHPSGDPLPTVAQAGEHLGTGERFVRRLITERRISRVKIGKYVRLKRSAVDAGARSAPAPPRRPAERPAWSAAVWDTPFPPPAIALRLGRVGLPSHRRHPGRACWCDHPGTHAPTRPLPHRRGPARPAHRR